MKDFLSNKESSDEFKGQSPVGKIVNFTIKTCCHRLYTGYKGRRIIGVSEVRHKQRIRPFPVYGENPQLTIIIIHLRQVFIILLLMKSKINFNFEMKISIFLIYFKRKDCILYFTQLLGIYLPTVLVKSGWEHITQ